MSVSLLFVNILNKTVLLKNNDPHYFRNGDRSIKYLLKY